MLSLLPDIADPLRLCALGKAYEGRVDLAEMPRLAPLLTSSEGEAAFALVFETDSERRPVVDVSVRATLALRCQRCMQRMDLYVESHSRLAVVFGPEEAEHLPDALDPLLLDEPRLVLRSLVEDELILSVPPAPRHAPDDCRVKLDEVNSAAEAAEPADEQLAQANPFAVLAKLKSDTE